VAYGSHENQTELPSDVFDAGTGDDSGGVAEDIWPEGRVAGEVGGDGLGDVLAEADYFRARSGRFTSLIAHLVTARPFEVRVLTLLRTRLRRAGREPGSGSTFVPPLRDYGATSEVLLQIRRSWRGSLRRRARLGRGRLCTGLFKFRPVSLNAREGF
jgi:hypothetical protein